MHKLITIIFTFLVGLFITSQAFAAVSVRVEQPKSPTNLSSFNLTFVALDTANQTLTAKCFVKKPSEGSFNQFGGDLALSAGGNTANCDVSSSVINNEGTYEFYVTASNGSETATSNTVSVEVKRSGPGTPVNYSKEKITSCEYKIKFKTANDSGKTVKVEVYRSENKSFDANSGTRVGSISVGSDTERDFTQSVPDCNKTYYYAVRAFDSAGNGSGVEGDKETTVTTNTINPTSPPGQGGAIPVGSSDQSGSVLGEETTVTPTPSSTDSEQSDADKGVKGTVASSSWLTPAKTTGIAIIVIAIALAYWYFRNRAKK